YRWADNQSERVPVLAAELVRRKVAVIVTTGGAQTALAAKAATTATPIVFTVANDPVRLGLVANLARPGGNLTGVSILLAELAAKSPWAARLAPRSRWIGKSATSVRTRLTQRG